MSYFRMNVSDVIEVLQKVIVYSELLKSKQVKMATDSERKQAELRKKIEYQVACEERAHRIVERLIDNPVTEEQLVNALHYITPSHYSDIVEERAVSKLCGYPLCPNDLPDVPKQKYVISTKTNKVYDIESRKNFCSARCYKISKHLECQVSSDPVWSRKNMRPAQFDILPLDSKIGKLGDEVIVSKAGEIKEDLNKLERLDKYQKTLAERIHEHNAEKEIVTKRESSDRTEDKEVEDKVRENTTQDGSVVYTLDKAVNELSLESNDSNELESKLKDKEQVRGESSVGENVPGVSVSTAGSENAKSQENSMQNVKKVSNTKSSKRKKEAGPSKSKTDYLMQLLDKRKALLAKMADIQNDNPKDKSKPRQKCEHNTDREEVADKSRRAENESKPSQEFENNSDRLEVADKSRTENTEANEDRTVPPENDKTELSGKSKTSLSDLSSETANLGENKSTVRSYCKSVAEKKKGKEFIKNTVKGGHKKPNAVSALDLICRGIQSWITVKTMEYFKVNETDENKLEQSSAATKFEKQYKELVAKVDAQEKDFDGLLGEETMDSEYNDKPTAPLPHFDILREELEADQIKVQEFMKGSFTYKVQEKQASDKDLEGSSGVVLPTVDRYDQMLIRQKIVLERISKVLPDVLSPLHLLVQDVFTELRELVCTFNLTSDNIMFKPAEWTIVTLVLLRMLSKRMTIIQRSFTSPGAEKYFTVLLSSIGASIDSIDATVNSLLDIKKARKVRLASLE